MTVRWKLSAKISLLFALAGLLAMPAAAQEDEHSSDKIEGWVSKAELSLVATSGNSDSTTFALKYDLSRKWQKSRLKLHMAGLRAESDTGTRFAVGPSRDDFEVVDTSASEVTAENYAVSGRYERDVSDKLFWFAGGGWERNEFAGVANRYVAEAGGGNVWHDSEKSRLETSYALTGTHQEDVVAGSGGGEGFVGVRLSLDGFRQLTGSTEWTSALMVDENLDDTSDLRARLEEAVAVAISDRLALKVSLELNYDNQPSFEALPLVSPDGTRTDETVLVELEELDTSLKTALVIRF